MQHLIRTIFIGLSVLFLSHFLTFFLIDVLPDSTNLALGIESTKKAVFQAFKESHKKRSYKDTLEDLLHGNLGKTLDGVKVNTEVITALKASFPRLIIAVGFILLGCVFIAVIPWKLHDVFIYGLGLTAFLPPYVFPFVMVTVMIGLGKADLLGFSELNHFMVGFTIAVSPAAYTMSQTSKIMKRNYESIHGRTLIAMGATSFLQRLRLLNNLVVELVSSMEKVLTSTVAALLFAEPILGLSGFGTMTLRAIRRSDIDLILASVIVLSITVCIARIASTGIRLYYKVEI